MIKLCLKFFILCMLCHTAFCEWESYAIVAPRVTFIIHKIDQPKFKFKITDIVGSAKAAKMCPSNETISWIVHGWKEGYERTIPTTWIPLVVNNTLKYGGGCVIVMDYSYYTNNDQAYDQILYRYSWLRDALANTIKLFSNYDKMHFFGFSFGSRLCQGAGKILTDANKGVPVISRMDLCDPAGPFFDGYDRRVPAKSAAKNVACINTSDQFNGYGTSIYDCHQNFRLGYCGKKQVGSTSPPMKSHGMCPYIYNNAFTYDYRYNEFYIKECTGGLNLISAECRPQIILGYRNTVFCPGDILIPTSICWPFLYTGTIYNYPIGSTSCQSFPYVINF